MNGYQAAYQNYLKRRQWLTEIKWWNWRTQTKSERECSVCGVTDERRNMVDVESYETFLVCEACMALMVS